MARDLEKYKSLILSDESGGEVRCSGEFRQDKGFIHYNTLKLLGDSDLRIELMRLNGLVRFREFKNDRSHGDTCRLCMNTF